MIVGVTARWPRWATRSFRLLRLAWRWRRTLRHQRLLVRWRWTHPTVAFCASIFLIWLLVRAAQRSTAWDNRRLSALVLLLLATVYTLGVLDVVLLAPLWLQVAHLLAADTLWTALVC